MANLPNVKSGDILSSNSWNNLINQVNDLALKIPTNVNGAIGINTQIPQAPLHVAGGTIISGVTIGHKTKEINYPWEKETIGVSDSRFNLRLQSPNDIYFHTAIKNELRDTHEKMSAEIRLAIRYDGNVGIGTDKPTQKLSVVGDINFNNHALIANYASTEHGGKNNVDHIWHKDQDNSWHFVSDNPYKAEGNAQLKAGSIYLKEAGQNSYFAGNLGVGTDTPSAKLDVKGTMLAIDLKASKNLIVNGVSTLKGVVTAESNLTVKGNVKCNAIEGTASHGGGELVGRGKKHKISFAWVKKRGKLWIEIYVDETHVKSISAWGEIHEGKNQGNTG